MALLRLALEIDSDVYPELYARLASIDRLPAREEKLRQLAATGLVWELVRMHGPALADLGPALSRSADPPGTVLVRPEDLDMAGALAVGEAPEPGERTDPLAHLDLALGPAEASEGEVPSNLPVLLDVVDEGGPLPPPEDLPSVTMATVVALRGDLEQPEVLDSGAEDPPPPSLSPRSGRSSRLKRMKDRGLFQNG